MASMYGLSTKQPYPLAQPRNSKTGKPQHCAGRATLCTVSSAQPKRSKERCHSFYSFPSSTVSSRQSVIVRVAEPAEGKQWQPDIPDEERYFEDDDGNIIDGAIFYTTDPEKNWSLEEDTTPIAEKYEPMDDYMESEFYAEAMAQRAERKKKYDEDFEALQAEVSRNRDFAAVVGPGFYKDVRFKLYPEAKQWTDEEVREQVIRYRSDEAVTYQSPLGGSPDYQQYHQKDTSGADFTGDFIEFLNTKGLLYSEPEWLDSDDESWDVTEDEADRRRLRDCSLPSDRFQYMTEEELDKLRSKSDEDILLASDFDDFELDLGDEEDTDAEFEDELIEATNQVEGEEAEEEGPEVEEEEEEEYVDEDDED